MAGDWIKVEHTTPDKPEITEMAEMLELTPEAVFTKLFRVWVWFDQQSLNGNAGRVTGVTLLNFIDRYISHSGFAEAMQKVGWLNASGITNFEYHNGETAKKRALTSKRVKRHRNVKRNAGVTPEVLPEKRREDITPLSTTTPLTLTPENQEPQPRNTGKGDAGKRALPADFGVSPRVERWAEVNGFNRLDDHLAAFRLKAQAKGYKYADWDAALMTAIREDWAGLRAQGEQQSANTQLAKAYLAEKGFAK